jgi:hypothetical protein
VRVLIVVFVVCIMLAWSSLSGCPLLLRFAGSMEMSARSSCNASWSFYTTRAVPTFATLAWWLYLCHSLFPFPASLPSSSARVFLSSICFSFFFSRLYTCSTFWKSNWINYDFQIPALSGLIFSITALVLLHVNVLERFNVNQRLSSTLPGWYLCHDF